MTDINRWNHYIIKKLQKEVEASRKQAIKARKERDQVASIFNEGRIAGLITAAKYISGETK